MAKGSMVLAPNYGLFLSSSSLTAPERAVVDGINFRIRNGRVESLNLGWELLSEDWQLNGRVQMIATFAFRNQSDHTLFATPTDVYLYDGDTDTLSFLTPIYDTGTAASSGTAVTGTGTSWSANVKAGDQIHFGDADFTDPDGPWFTIANVGGNTSLTLESTSGVVANGDYTIRQVLTAEETAYWSWDTFMNDGVSGDDLWIATNGTDDVMSWAEGDAQITLHPELGFKCKVLRNFANMMIYGNIIDGVVELPTTIINSDVGSPLLAGDVGVGLSEQFVVHGGSEPIMTLDTLGDYFLIGSQERAFTMVQFSEATVFIFRQALNDVGPISFGATANYGDYIQFLSRDAMYSFDGVNMRVFGDQIWREVLRQIDPVRRDQVFNAFDEERGEVIWAVPLTTDNGAGDPNTPVDIAFTTHYLEDTGTRGEIVPHSRRDFPFTAIGDFFRTETLTWDDALEAWSEYNYAWNDQFFALAFPMKLVGDDSGFVYMLSETQTANGDELPSYVTFGRRLMRDGRERTLLYRVYPYVQQYSQTMQVTAMLADHAAGPATITDSRDFSTALAEGAHFVTFNRRGRFFALKFGATDGSPWVLEGYDVEIAGDGSGR